MSQITTFPTWTGRTSTRTIGENLVHLYFKATAGQLADAAHEIDGAYHSGRSDAVARGERLQRHGGRPAPQPQLRRRALARLDALSVDLVAGHDLGAGAQHRRGLANFARQR